MTDLVHVDATSTYSLVPHAAELAEKIARTDFAPAGLRGKPEAVMAAMLTGNELGIGPMAALSEIGVINGKPCLSAKLMRGLVQRAGHEIWFAEKTNTRVTICAQRSGWPEDRVAKVTWTMDDANRAGLGGGQNYRKYPRAMLAARATGEICRDNFADVLGGIGYTPEELTDGDLVAGDDLLVDGRDDVADEQPTTRRRAARAVTTAATKKAPAKKAAAATQAPLEPAVVPLPGEPGFDDPTAAVANPDPVADEDIVDAEVIEDDPPEAPASLLEAGKAKGFTQAQLLRRARGIAEDQGATLPNTLDEVQGDVLAALVDDLGLAMPAGGGGPSTAELRNRKMWALVAECEPVEGERDQFRRTLIGLVSAGRTESSKELEDDEWSALFDALDGIKDGVHHLHLRSNGEWELRRTPGGRS